MEGIGRMLNQGKAIIINYSHGNDRLVNRDFVLGEQVECDT